MGHYMNYRYAIAPDIRLIAPRRHLREFSHGLAPKSTSPQQELRNDYSLLRQIRAAQLKHSHQAEFRPTLNSTISCRTGAHLSFRGGGAEGAALPKNGLAPAENCPEPPPITTG